MGNALVSEEICLHIMQFIEWEDRHRMGGLSRRCNAITNSQSYYHWCCDRLAEEHFVYCPTDYIPKSWKVYMKELYALRSMWKVNPLITADKLEDEVVPIQEPVSGNRYKINVYARFRPNIAQLKPAARKDANKVHSPARKSPSKITKAGQQEPATDKENNQNGQNEGKCVEVNLPLHQRLAMIKMSHKLKSNKEALKVLAAEGGWFQKKWDNVNVVSQDDRLIEEKVDPQSIPKFQNNSEKEVIVASVQSVDVDTGHVVMIAPDVGIREFVFDGVLNHSSNQSQLYELSTKRLVIDFINGYNATAVVYGQTGSGKSYSMFGENEAAINTLADRKRGIVPRACAEIFQAIADREKLGIVSTLGVTYIEIYGDYVADLLRNGERVGHSQVASQRFVLSGAAEHPVSSMEDIAEVLRIGDTQKRRAATAMNDRSSRAHALFILSLTQTRYESKDGSALEAGAQSTVRTSKLFLADLGGSEQVKKSKVEAGGHRLGIDDQFSAGFEMAEHMREAVYINLGLLALKKVIEALNNKSVHVPYNDSKLTMLLSAGLGGNCKTSVIVCANMDPEHATETVATLRFGERCSLIETEARNNANMLASLLRDLDRRISDLEQQIREKERWELREETRTDELAEEGTVEAAVKVEVKKVYIPVGAENERIEMERLLKQRAKFTGSAFDDEEEDNTAAVTSSSSNSRHRGKRVVGFGRQVAEMYGIGERYDWEQEFAAENNRFEETVSEELLPNVIKAKAGKAVKQWVSNPVADPTKLAAKAKKVNRQRLNYAGMSAGGGW